MWHLASGSSTSSEEQRLRERAETPARPAAAPAGPRKALPSELSGRDEQMTGKQPCLRRAVARTNSDRVRAPQRPRCFKGQVPMLPRPLESRRPQLAVRSFGFGLAPTRPRPAPPRSSTLAARPGYSTIRRLLARSAVRAPAGRRACLVRAPCSTASTRWIGLSRRRAQMRRDALQLPGHWPRPRTLASLAECRALAGRQPVRSPGKTDRV